MSIHTLTLLAPTKPPSIFPVPETMRMLRQLCRDSQGLIRHRRAPIVAKLLAELEIGFVMDPFDDEIRMFNFYAPPVGTGKVWIVAHHDVWNRKSENANDNTASVVNAMILKANNPGLGLLLTDGEEPPHLGSGSRRFCATEHARTDHLYINLELTGIGGWPHVGREALHGPDQSRSLCRYLAEQVMPTGQEHQPGEGIIQPYTVPFNDATILRGGGLDAVCLFTCTRPGKGLDHEQLNRMHTVEDDLGWIDPWDMANFRAGLVQRLRSQKLLP